MVTGYEKRRVVEEEVEDMEVEEEGEKEAMQVEDVSYVPSFHPPRFSSGYKQGVDWMKGEAIGSGVSGACYKALDKKSGCVIAVKEVIYIMDLRLYPIVWSADRDIVGPYKPCHLWRSSVHSSVHSEASAAKGRTCLYTFIHFANIAEVSEAYTSKRYMM